MRSRLLIVTTIAGIVLAGIVQTSAAAGTTATQSAASCTKQTSTGSVSYAPAPEVKTLTNGSVTGCIVDDEIRLYRQIPFAAPPVGPLRWVEPQTATWTGQVDGTFAPPTKKCVQYGRGANSDGSYPLDPLSTEDCLVLNVHTRSTSPTAKQPVFVWIHGGGGNYGDIEDPIYDATTLAARTGAVVVLLNYRMGVFGFMAHPGLAAETGGVTSGNYGVLDLIKGLTWVRDNIQAFGGDPKQVTVAGESAGAVLINLLVGSPRAAGLFQAAIMQSNAMGQRLDSQHFGFTFPTQAKVQPLGLMTAANLTPAPGTNCSRPGNPSAEVACMRSVTDLLSLLNAFPTSSTVSYPNLDGDVIVNGPLTGAAHAHNDVSMIVGNNANEWYTFALASRYGVSVSTEAEYVQLLQNLWGDVAWQRIYAQYPPGFNYAVGVNPYQAAAIQAATDGAFTCFNRKLVQNFATHAAFQQHPIYPYFYQHVLAPPLAFVGTPHAADLFALFNSWSFLNTALMSITNQLSYTPTAADYRTSVVMETYWGKFTASGNPNLPATAGAVRLPYWLPATGASGYGPTILLDAMTTVAVGTEVVDESRCAFWDSLGVYDNTSGAEQ